ncbi:orotate phosphoribosyltransferase [Buchnera aphidicola str. Ak (Acyrthosiphon kondoi)]|uniref:Orotate phosphoribosyltransferase n=1 Tax=Buchnera aphidicola str. Ak (Acyrthosiphon kondoi) TaxID=1005090 RepID=G2LM42_9GAMM|nr:orotate phosphoribosyltransferase [Buchnera aphidicola]AEO08889.1 orotate phosphoribosyltransferase [Buchnera aphidicola str. Ak (Acyrthosiphon kondoi)]
MDWKKKFIDFSFKKKALQFGSFKLKSGRTSPYFFNSGLLSTGTNIIEIGLFYARSIVDSKMKFDVLFGPAYKGIPITVTTSIALKNYYDLNIPYAFNRKEYKKHGEKGDLIGATIYKKRIIILDDVVTSGKAIHHSIKIIEEQGAEISAVFVLLDRKEKGERDLCTINHQKNKKKYEIISIITIEDLISYLLEDKKLKKHIPKLIKYREKYGI